MKSFFLYLYDLDRTIAFIKHSDSAEINCAWIQDKRTIVA